MFLLSCWFSKTLMTQRVSSLQSQLHPACGKVFIPSSPQGPPTSTCLLNCDFLTSEDCWTEASRVHKHTESHIVLNLLHPTVVMNCLIGSVSVKQSGKIIFVVLWEGKQKINLGENCECKCILTSKRCGKLPLRHGARTAL